MAASIEFARVTLLMLIVCVSRLLDRLQYPVLLKTSEVEKGKQLGSKPREGKERTGERAESGEREMIRNRVRGARSRVGQGTALPRSHV